MLKVCHAGQSLPHHWQEHNSITEIKLIMSPIYRAHSLYSVDCWGCVMVP